MGFGWHNIILIMEFNGQQLSAMVKLGVAMASADGKVANEETSAISAELVKFGVTPNEVVLLLKGAKEMSPADALTIISTMNNEQKKYVTGYLAVIMVSDGEIADSETKLWQLICALGSFPAMTLEDALNFWKNN